MRTAGALRASLRGPQRPRKWRPGEQGGRDRACTARGTGGGAVQMMEGEAEETVRRGDEQRLVRLECHQARAQAPPIPSMASSSGPAHHADAPSEAAAPASREPVVGKRSGNTHGVRHRDRSQWRACDRTGQLGTRISGCSGAASSAAMSRSAFGFQFHGSIASRSRMRAVGSRCRMSAKYASGGTPARRAEPSNE